MYKCISGLSSRRHLQCCVLGDSLCSFWAGLNNNKLQRSVPIKKHKTVQISGMCVSAFLCLVGRQRSWTAQMFLLYLFCSPLQFSTGCQGSCWWTAPSAVVAGRGFCFPLPLQRCSSTHLWAQALATEEHPQPGKQAPSKNVTQCNPAWAQRAEITGEEQKDKRCWSSLLCEQRKSLSLAYINLGEISI